MRRLRRASRDQVFRNDPRLRADPRGEIRVRQLGLGGVQRRVEAAVDADFDQPHQGGNVMRQAGEEFLEHRRRRGPVPFNHRRLRRDLDHGEAGVRRRSGDLAAEQRDLVRTRRLVIEQAPEDAQAIVARAGQQLGFRDLQQQHGIVGGGLSGQEPRRRRDVAAIDMGLPQLLRNDPGSRPTSPRHRDRRRPGRG